MRWERARLTLRCANSRDRGCQVHAGEWALFGKWRHRRRTVLCRTCAAKDYRMYPPARNTRAWRAAAAVVPGVHDPKSAQARNDQ